MAFCIPQFGVDKFVAKLKDGSFSPEKLASLTSDERRTAFSDVVGPENAKQVNALFESKLLLKNQQLGMISWAKKVAGLSESVRADMLSKIGKLDKVLNPDEQSRFLSDLVEQKLGVHVSVEEAGKLTDAAKKVNTFKDAIPKDSPEGSKERLDYGAALVEFKNYVGELKAVAEKTKNTMGSVLSTDTIYKLAGTAKALKATLDNSFFGRQGLKVLATHPTVWVNAIIKSLGDFAKEIKGTSAVDAIKADVYSRENAINGKYRAAKIAIGIDGEEAMPINLLDKIPVLGRLFKASESMYNGAALRMRADVADLLIKKAEDAGINTLDKTQAEPIGRIVNSLTGRGDIGKLNTVGKEINLAFFSIKFLKSNIETLTDPINFGKKMSPFARKEAALNLAKIVGTVGTVMAVAKMLSPDDNKDIFNPTSTNFGKIKVGATTIDVTGGMGSLATLVGRIASLKSTSGTTGKTTQLNTGKYGAPTALDTFLNFGEGKLSPGLAIMADYLRGKDFSGNKPTVGSTLYNAAMPLPIDTALNLLQNPKGAPLLAGMITDGLGFSTNTYVPPKKK